MQSFIIRGKTTFNNFCPAVPILNGKLKISSRAYVFLNLYHPNCRSCGLNIKTSYSTLYYFPINILDIKTFEKGSFQKYLLSHQLPQKYVSGYVAPARVPRGSNRAMSLLYPIINLPSFSIPLWSPGHIPYGGFGPMLVIKKDAIRCE